MTHRPDPAPLYLDTLCDRLRNHPELEGVVVLSAPGGEAGEWVAFANITETTEFGPMGRTSRPVVNYSFTLEGSVWVERSGAGDDLAAEVRNRAYEILGVVEDLISDGASGVQNLTPRGARTALWARINQRNLWQGVNDSGRSALIEFNIVAEDRS